MIAKARKLLKSLGGHMTFRHIKNYVGAAYLAQGVGAVRSFLNARFLGPSDYGFWGWLGFIVTFGYFLHLGAQEMMLKEVPGLRAQGRLADAERLVRLNLTFYLVMLCAAAMVILAVAFTRSEAATPVHRAGWFIIAAVMVLEVLFNFEQVVARSMGFFSEVGGALFATNLISLALTCWLVVHHGLAGIYWVALLTPLFGLWYLHRYTRYPLRFAWDIRLITEKIRRGWPVVTMGLLFLAVSWVDRGIIMKYLGVRAHGFYTLGTMISVMLFLFPKGLAEIFEPKLHFHHAPDNPEYSITRNFLRPVRILAWAMPACLLAGHGLLPWVLQLALPAYLPGLLVMRILIWSSFFGGMIAMTKSSLVALDRQARTLPAIVAAVAINAGVSLWMVDHGYGVAGVGLGSTVALGIVSVWLIGLVLGDFVGPKGVIYGYFLQIYLPFVLLGVPSLAVAWVKEVTGLTPAAWLYGLQAAGIVIYSSVCISLLRKLLAGRGLEGETAEPAEVVR